MKNEDIQSGGAQDWLVWSTEHHGWWRPNSHGYTPMRAEAGRYSFEEAAEICRSANRGCNRAPCETMVIAPEMETKVLGSAPSEGTK